MKLAIISHKPCWHDPEASSVVRTTGGFPFQISAISDLFEQTTLLVPLVQAPLPEGLTPLTGRNLQTLFLRQPPGIGLRRKLSMPTWLLVSFPHIWYAVRQADAVHVPIPGDIGTFGIVAALMQRKPLFVRYCGVWNRANTLAERFWQWLLVKIAGGRNVVLATGGGSPKPSAQNESIDWIFSTSLSQDTIDALSCATSQPSLAPLRLITVGRQVAGKNTDLVIKALARLREGHSAVTLDVVGDGAAQPALRQLVAQLGLDDSVHFHGNVPHQRVLDLLRKATIFCFPTNSEGFPKAVHEALACGLPVVTTNVSVLPDLIERNRCGMIIESRTPDSIAAAISEIAADSAAYQEMSSNARQVARRYSLENWRDAINEKLQEAWGPFGYNAN